MPTRIALGALIIPKKMQFTDREAAQENRPQPDPPMFSQPPKFPRRMSIQSQDSLQISQAFRFGFSQRINTMLLPVGKITEEYPEGKPEKPKTNNNPKFGNKSNKSKKDHTKIRG